MTVPRPAAAHGSPDELLARAAQGDVSAFARIIRLRHEAVTRSTLAVSLDAAIASEAATLAFAQAWRALHRGSWFAAHQPRTAGELDQWLGAMAVSEAVSLLAIRTAVDGYLDASVPPTPALVDPGPLAGLDADDRALLVLAVLVDAPPGELARAAHSNVAQLQARVDHLVAAVLGELPPAAGTPGGRRLLRARLVAWSATVPVPRVDADRVARTALASDVHEREHRASVLIGVVAGLAVASYPYWAPLVFRR